MTTGTTPARSAPRRARVNSSRATLRPRRPGWGRGATPASRAPYLCRAGWNLSRAKPREPRHKQRRLSLPTACAASSAQLPPYGVAVPALLRPPLATNHSPLATAFLVATVTNSKIGLTHSQHVTYENSTRNKFALFQDAPSATQARRRQDASGTSGKGKTKSAKGGDRMAA